MQIAIKVWLSGDDALRDTIRMANSACQDIIDVGLKTETFNKSKLHTLTYRNIRDKYPALNSSLVTAVRDQASNMLKRLKLKKRPVKKSNSSVTLNHNTFKLFADSKEVSLSTISGRRKYKIIIPPYFSRYKFTQSTSARIRMVRGKFMLDVITDIKVPKTSRIERIVGVDRGIYHPAVASDNQFFNSKRLRAVKGRYRHLKGCLQCAGTRSAMRHLKKMSGRERRFVTDANHCISKAIVSSDCSAIAAEELNVGAMKMRKKRAKGKKARSLIGSWSPTQLLSFIKYKAEMIGKPIILVNSHFTSQACSQCGDIRRANRHGRLFKCCVCGFTLHADLNASRNIASLAKGGIGRLRVNQPIVACNELKASLREELRASIVTSLASQMRGS